MAEEVVLPIPNLSLPQNLYVLSNPALKHLHEKAREELMEGIKADEMGPWYRSLTSALSPSSSSSMTLPLDKSLLESLEKANEEELKRLDERLEAAEKTEGETEISDTLKARANYLTRIGDKDKALEAQKVALDKAAGLGSRIDIVLTIVRIGFFFSDTSIVTEYMAKAEKLIDEGGDWDRRNRLKVYRALHFISIRQFKRAADLFLDALSTFTATEVISFNDFVSMAVVSGALTLSRVDLKKKVIAAPEVNQVIPEKPVLGDLVKNLYESHYDKFFVALATLEQTFLIPSRILYPHARYYVREMRILAYAQLLESYRSLTLESLARAFGVSVEFIDGEIARFIANGRLHARIDRVNGIVETTRPSSKSAQYETLHPEQKKQLRCIRVWASRRVYAERRYRAERVKDAVAGTIDWDFPHLLSPAHLKGENCGLNGVVMRKLSYQEGDEEAHETLLPQSEGFRHVRSHSRSDAKRPYVLAILLSGNRRRVLVKLFLLLIGASVIFLGLVSFVKPNLRLALESKQQTPDDTDLSLPPRYTALRNHIQNLPQHNTSLPFPEGRNGRYVKFTCQIGQLGWNNVLNELLMNAHLAYRSNRAYVFSEYDPQKTPLAALMSGPVVGDGWPKGTKPSSAAAVTTPKELKELGQVSDAPPRSVFSPYWEEVCPPHKRKIISTSDVKPWHKFGTNDKQGTAIFEYWLRLLTDGKFFDEVAVSHQEHNRGVEGHGCVEIVPAPREEDLFPQVFDLWLWGGDRVLSLWEEFKNSPIASVALGTSAVVERCIKRNTHLFERHRKSDSSPLPPADEDMDEDDFDKRQGESDPFARVLAVHIRRGDFKAACQDLADYNTTYYSWNQQPFFPDHFLPPPFPEGKSPGPNNQSPENVKIYTSHCLPDDEAIVKKVREGRRDWEAATGRKVQGEEHYLDTLFLLTNERDMEWLGKLKKEFIEEDGWKNIVISSLEIEYGDAQEKDVGMAVDMDLARRAAVFIGNGLFHIEHRPPQTRGWQDPNEHTILLTTVWVFIGPLYILCIISLRTLLQWDSFYCLQLLFTTPFVKGTVPSTTILIAQRSYTSTIYLLSILLSVCYTTSQLYTYLPLFVYIDCHGLSRPHFRSATRRRVRTIRDDADPAKTSVMIVADQFDKISSFFETHIELIGDIREIYAQRAALEREYAGKLQVLAKKAADKKAKMEQQIAVGPDPSKAWDAGTLKSSTLNVAYDEIINSMSSTADDHSSIADSLTSQVVEVLRVVERRSDAVKQKELNFFNKLLADRDRTYNDRLKAKQKYDEDCLEVESFRQKQSRANDDKHAERAAKQADQQRTDMLNSKNVYLISIAIANQAKARFYTADLPRLEDEYQGLQTRLVQRLVKILLHCQRLQQSHLDSLKARVGNVEARLNAVDPVKDEALFAAHNSRQFTMPLDWKFEPCQGHYDTDQLSVDPAPKVFIQNKLRRSKEKLSELQSVIYSKKTEVAQAARPVNSYQPDHTLGPIDDSTDASTGFFPSSIWGLSKQGKTCKACGVSVHNKCELKFPANCGQPDEPAPLSASLARSSTTASTASRSSRNSSMSDEAAPMVHAPTPSSFVKDTHSEKSSIAEAYPSARVIYDFKASSEFELAVQEDEVVQIVEEDDGSGWVKVLNEQGQSGLVPATYLEEVEESTAPVSMPVPTRAPAPVSRTQGSGERVRAIYPYAAQGADEIGLQEGEVLELSSGMNGGRNYGEGWWEGYNSKGQKGIFPSNYRFNRNAMLFVLLSMRLRRMVERGHIGTLCGYTYRGQSAHNQSLLQPPTPICIQSTMKPTPRILSLTTLFTLCGGTAANSYPRFDPELNSTIKPKAGPAVDARDSTNLLQARAPVIGVVSTDFVRYRRCASTSCDAIGQYNKGHVIDICRTRGESVNGWVWWDRMSNGYYISDYYVDWSGGIPPEC
ncbi:hypothetical protein NMY22_g1574 [Coprinellus aureogranulatus]|nr:hypothetical protein NMY22_g1574 [Coprinellus aureogranulatus]